MNITTESGVKKRPLESGRNYGEVISLLASKSQIEYSEEVLKRTKALDALFDHVSRKTDVILIGGSNGKSSSANLTAKLLKKEGFKVGVAYSSHFLTYNERLAVDGQQINNRDFTDVVDKVLTEAELNKINATAFEIMTIASLLYASQEKAEVIVLEVGIGGRYDATAICNPKIMALTRVADGHSDVLGDDLDEVAGEIMAAAKPGTWFISSEQSKLRLQKMKTFASKQDIKWAMPIRKLASLPYIYEQLYGRVASLGERVAQLYVEEIKGDFSPFLRGNLLATKRGQRGRPTLEAKRNAELNPIKSLQEFWRDDFELMRGRFELLDKEKPTVLIDNAQNLDALENLFLGIRLLHYQKPLRGLALVLGLKKTVDAVATLKVVRYLMKKVSGQLFFAPLPGNVDSYSTDDLVKIAHGFNLNAKGYNSIEQAFDVAKKTVDDRYGLVCLTGSPDVPSVYWRSIREMKKF